MYSIRLKLFISFLMIGILTAVILSIIFISTINQLYVTEKKRELYRQANTIAISLVTSGYFEEESNKQYLATIQASVPGRGLVLDRQGMVLFDSNHLDTGKLFSNSETLEALTGDSSYVFEKETNRGIVTVPIMNVDFDSVLGAVIVTDSFDDISDSISSLIGTVVLVVFGLILVIAVLSYSISGSFNRPFRQLINHIKKVRDGHIDQTIKIAGNKEIVEIADAFNQMIERLHNIEMNRQQFVANVSHELKTPISSVKVLAESLIHQPDVPIEIYQDFMQDINEELDRENKIINDLLTLVTLDRNDYGLRVEEVTMNDMVAGIMKRLKPLADLKQIQLVFESRRIVQAEVDVTKLDLAISNLIENGIKYNKEYGYITVVVDTDFKDCIIKIRDTGEGIPADSLLLIFQRFYRVDKTRSRETGGTGLGLSIVQKTVQMHKGHISCESEVGEWTEFTLTIPLKQQWIEPEAQVDGYES